MTISSFLGLQTSLRGLLAHQEALDVTAHNISNASTQGYSRQEATMAAATPLQVPALLGDGGLGVLPQGVDVQAVSRMRDAFADLQYRAQNMAHGQGSTTAQSLSETEDSLAEPSDDGLSKLLSQFWDSWNSLSNGQTDAARQAVVTQAQLLTGRINALSGQLQAVGTDAANQYAQITGSQGDVLAAANEVAQMNGAIKAVQSAGGQPNDLLDRRDRALDKLSSLAQVSVTNLGDGAVRVTFGDAAQPLVDGSTVNWPQVLASPGGKLGALLQLSRPSTGTIAGYVSDLDAFATTLASSVNNAYGGTFFYGSSAATLAVAATPATVRASNQPGPPAGANDVALAVAALRGGTADTSYATFVARIGSDSKAASQQQDTAQALLGQADDRRQSTSGVSMDEEMTNMVRFQRGYQASARAMSTMDEMLDTLINRTGKVGL